jgi:hypothetical protein
VLVFVHPGIAWMLWRPVVAALEPQLMAQLEVRFHHFTEKSVLKTSYYCSSYVNCALVGV